MLPGGVGPVGGIKKPHRGEILRLFGGPGRPPESPPLSMVVGFHLLGGVFCLYHRVFEQYFRKIRQIHVILDINIKIGVVDFILYEITGYLLCKHIIL